MRLLDLGKSATESLLRTKARSALTMLGIVIGIMSVILMLSIGEAAQRFILSQISSFGSDVLYVSNGSSKDEGQPTLFVKETLAMKDVRKLKAQPWVSLITGVVNQSDQLTAGSYDTSAQILGTMPDELRFNDRRVRLGAFFDASAVDARERVVVLGSEIADKSFGQNDPLGKSVKISGQSFRVIGVMEPVGTQSFQNVDKQVYMPVTAALDLYNKKYLTRIAVRTSVPLDQAKMRIQLALRDSHNLDNPQGDLAKDDFTVTTQEDAVRSASEVTNILQILLSSIAAISLVVGGIGIMNIMYVSVTERVKEIGLRMAIGARKADVLRQFLVEAVMLTSLGGVLGIALGVSLAYLGIAIISTFQSGWTFALTTRGIWLGLVVSAAIGLVFGYFPARRAAKLHPIEALRFE
jgi:putative ABC transport system permease protein